MQRQLKQESRMRPNSQTDLPTKQLHIEIFHCLQDTHKKKIWEKKGEKITRMCNVLNSEDVRKLTFCCIISLVK
jgi:hypothetical protein